VKTVILCRGRYEVAETDNRIPLNDNLSVDYSGWTSIIIDQWPVRSVEVKRDLGEVFG
jgi:hypothetical protein